MAELRLELFGVVQELQTKITQIDARIDAIDKTKDGKESKEKEKEGKDTKEKEKEGKDDKDDKDKDQKEKDKESEKEKDGHHKDEVDFGSAPGTLTLPHDEVTGPPADDEGTERTFITLAERPDVGRGALADPDEER
jgi:archaellum component FlaD/FlaE